MHHKSLIPLTAVWWSLQTIKFLVGFRIVTQMLCQMAQLSFLHV